MKLEIVFGPMYSGKSTRLLHELSRYQKGPHKKIFMINSKVDTRVTENLISTHNTTISTSELNTIKALDLMEITNSKEFEIAEVIGIDEAQFFRDLVTFCLYAVEERGKHVIVSGLAEDFQRNKFGHILDLIPYADHVTKLNALCKCGKDAIFTKRISASKEQVLVGANDAYIAVCRNCFKN